MRVYSLIAQIFVAALFEFPLPTASTRSTAINPTHNVADAYIMHRQSHRAGISAAEERFNIWEYCTRQ